MIQTYPGNRVGVEKVSLTCAALSTCVPQSEAKTPVSGFVHA